MIQMIRDTPCAGRPRLTIELPTDISDDAVLHIAQFLEDLAGCFEEHYHKKLVRAYRARDRQHAELRRQQGYLAGRLGLLREGGDEDENPPF